MTDLTAPRILFVCLGNICRSPAAEGVLRSLRPDWQIDSAGTSDWHIGEPPYDPMQTAARARGVDLAPLRARQFSADDFARFDLILAMDASVLRKCQKMAPNTGATLRLFCADGSDVPDPYYTRDFDGCLDLITSECTYLAESPITS